MTNGLPVFFAGRPTPGLICDPHRGVQLRSKTIDSWTNAEDGQRPDHPAMTSALRGSAPLGSAVAVGLKKHGESEVA